MMHLRPSHFLFLLLLAAAPLARADSASADLATYLQRRSALKPKDIPARLDLARWCHGQELLSQMADLCAEVLAIDPENRPAYNMLRDYDALHTMPEEPAAAAAVEKELAAHFKQDFKTKETRHFTIIYDTTDQFAAARGAQLEQAYNMFYVYFDMQRLRPTFLQHRLISVIFKNFDDYTLYAKQIDGSDTPWAAGYYSGRTNRTAFYDDSTGPGGAQLDKTISDLRAQVADLNLQISANQKKNAIAIANDLIRQRNDAESKLLALTRNTETLMEHFNAIKTLHEATHQLAFNTGIQSRFVDNPLWLSEGLATSFESTAKDGSRGPAVVNLQRLDAVRDAIKNDKFQPLKTFLAAPPEHLDNATAAIFYAQSWSLFHFLYRTDRAGLEKYLMALQSQKPGVRLSPQQQLNLFTSSFTLDLDTIEERWRKYLQSL